MENQENKSAVTGFQKLAQRFQGLIRSKRRNFKIHELEARRITNRIREIKNRRPELSKYLSKIPEFRSNTNDSEIRLADIRKYNVNLLKLLDEYELELNKESWFI
ncbi:MAG: hypothetical protein ACO1N0_13285 [Fluviicola sp.]